jgi:hypothetical protein
MGEALLRRTDSRQPTLLMGNSRLGNIDAFSSAIEGLQIIAMPFSVTASDIGWNSSPLPCPPVKPLLETFGRSTVSLRGSPTIPERPVVGSCPAGRRVILSDRVSYPSLQERDRIILAPANLRRKTQQGMGIHSSERQKYSLRSHR